MILFFRKVTFPTKIPLVILPKYSKIPQITYNYWPFFVENKIEI